MASMDISTTSLIYDSLKRYPESKQFDMHKLFMTDPSVWPERDKHDHAENLSRSWCHSDIREMAYCHNWKVFEKITVLGKLN
jgi:hypothetical protein